MTHAPPTPREVVVGFFDDMEQGRVAQAFARLAPDVIYHLIAPEPYGGVMDLAGISKVTEGVFARLAEPLKVTLHTIIAEGDCVAVEASSLARTKAGGVYNNHYFFLYKVRDGIIVEAKEYFDSAHYLTLINP
jgi:ketosteroid isomerase-like protein